MRQFFLLLSFMAAVTAAPSAQAQKAGDKDAWAKDVAFTTDWKKAIKSVRESGKMLIIYNGWKRSGI